MIKDCNTCGTCKFATEPSTCDECKSCDRDYSAYRPNKNTAMLIALREIASAHKGCQYGTVVERDSCDVMVDIAKKALHEVEG